MRRYPYLLYPLVWFFPPLHELVHCLICWCYGLRVVDLQFRSMRFEGFNSDAECLHQIHDSPLSVVVVMVCLVCFFYYLWNDVELWSRLRRKKDSKNYV